MILSLLLLPSLALTALGQALTPAPVITNNPPVTYTATLSNNPNTSIRGYVTASGAPDGIGVVFRVNFTGLPPNIGPFRMMPHLELRSEFMQHTNVFNQLITSIYILYQQAVIVMPLVIIWTLTAAANNLLVTQVTRPLVKLVILAASMDSLLEMISLPCTMTPICLLIPTAMLSSATGPSSSMLPLLHA